MADNQCYINDYIFPNRTLGLTLNQIKNHLNIDPSYTDDDNYLRYLVAVAEEVIEHEINCKLDDTIEDGGIPSSIVHSMLLLIGNWYLNREPVSYATVNKLPYTLDLLLSVNKNYK